MSKPMYVLLLAIALIVIGLVVLEQREIKQNQTCSKIITLPADERVVSATDKVVLTTTNNTEPKTYHVRSTHSNYCFKIQER